MAATEDTPAPRPTRPPSARPTGAVRPGSIADAVSGGMRTRIPPPPGRNLALLLIGAAAVIALLVSFLRGGGPGDQLRRSVEEREKEPHLPVTRVGDDAPPAPRPGPTEGTPRTPPERFPTERPLPRVATPEGLQVGLARELEGRLALLAGDVVPARAALRDLARLVASAPEDRREELRSFALGQVAGAARREGLRSASFDAGLALGAKGEAGKTLVEIAAKEGLDDDGAAGAAIVFLLAQPDAGGPDVLARIDALVADGYRPLHLRLLAAHLRPREGRPESVSRLADDPSTPAPLREALR